MLILGMAGGLARQQEKDRFDLGRTLFHDSAIALLSNGDLVFAAEEERFNRIKHTNKAPLSAIRAGLSHIGANARDIDHVAYYADDQALTAALASRGLAGVGSFRDALARLLEQDLGWRGGSDRLHFVRHHLAHAESAYRPSGFESALVMTFDAMGEMESGLICDAAAGEIDILRVLPLSESLGFLYADLIRAIGFSHHEEYKVMGLAPYGDPARFRADFSALFSLLPDGYYGLHRDRLPAVGRLVRSRRRSDPIAQEHKDFAAALQDALETIVFHLAGHFRETTGRRDLCLAGGLAQNCSMNGMLLASGLFERVFVQPASTDSGCAIGAALHVAARQAGASAPQALGHVYLGRDLGTPNAIASALDQWSRFILLEALSDPSGRGGELLAEGLVIGWMQGRSEFGPRALGNRSILADPRPASNRDRINGLVKKREGFRPFAPAVLEEVATDYFEWPERGAALSFMTFVVKVREEARLLLGATTHVDGTARVQTVSRGRNERFWRLIERFGQITGVPVVLNTSFNNHREPIVDTIDDGVTALLTTGLDAIIVGDWLVRRRDEVSAADFLSLVPELPPHLGIVRHGDSDSYLVTSNEDISYRVPLSAAMADVLRRSDSAASWSGLLAGRHFSAERLVEEIRELWRERVITLRPGPVVPR